MAYIGRKPTDAPLTSSDIADGIISTADIANTAVTGAKVNTDIISAQTALATAPADTDEFLVSDAGTIKRIDYSLIKGGGGLIHIKTQTASNSSSIDFNHGSSDVILDSTYNKYCFMIDIKPANDNVTPQLLVSTDAGSSYLSSNYVYSMDGVEAGGSHFERDNGADSQIEITPQTQGNASDEHMSLTLYLSSPARASSHKYFYWMGVHSDPTGNVTNYQGAGSNTGDTNAVTGVRFKFSGGNIELGTIGLFGVANS